MRFRSKLETRNSKLARGVALLLALIAVLIAMTLAGAFVSAQSTTMGIARNVRDHAQARQVAESGMELAIAYVRSSATWRTDKPNGTWVGHQSFGPGAFTVKGEDGIDADDNGTVDGDGSLSDDATDVMTLTVTGTVNGATHWVRTVVTPPSAGRFGFDTEFAGQQSGVREKQIATRVNLPQDGTVTSISAYVKGPPPKDLRMAIYTDASGEPGARVVQTGSQDTGSNTFYWHTIDITPTPLTAGDYWLAICFEHNNQYYSFDSSGGQTRYNNLDAISNGFSAAWGASTVSSTRRINMYATFSSGGSGAGTAYQIGWTEAP